MTWFLLKLEKGENYPQEFYWPEGIDAFIPASIELIKQPTLSPNREKVQLYYRRRISNERIPLLWIDDKGEQECVINISKWVEALKYESYRSEYRRPIMARMPFNYHYIPEKIRFNILSLVIKCRYYFRSLRESFPVSQHNCGCEILLTLYSSIGNLQSKSPLLMLTHDVETKYGFAWIERIAKIEEKFGFRSLWNIVPKRYHINKNILYNLLKHDNEIGMHGIWHNGKEAFLSEKQLRDEFSNLKSFKEEFKINGYRSPAWLRTKKMYDVLSDYFAYDLSCLDNDLMCPAGNGGVGLGRPFRFKSGLVEFPCTLPFEYPLYLDFSAERLIKYWRPKIDFIKNFNGMLLVTTHPDPNYLGNTKMIAIYEKLLGILADEGWRARLPRDITGSVN